MRFSDVLIGVAIAIAIGIVFFSFGKTDSDCDPEKTEQLLDFDHELGGACIAVTIAGADAY